MSVSASLWPIVLAKRKTCQQPTGRMPRQNELQSDLLQEPVSGAQKRICSWDLRWPISYRLTPLGIQAERSVETWVIRRHGWRSPPSERALLPALNAGHRCFSLRACGDPLAPRKGYTLGLSAPTLHSPKTRGPDMRSARRSHCH